MKFGSFDTTSSGWSFRSSQGAFAIGERDTSDYSSAPAGYKVTCITAGSQPDNIQLFTMTGNYVKITAGKQYKLTFRAKSDGGNITPTISLMKRLSPGTAYDTPKEVAISSTWETYTITFTASTTDDAARITFYLGGMPAGSTLHIDSVSFKEATESSGNVKQTYYYDAFGNITEQSGDVDNNITYAGYQYDKETGLYYLNSRMYDPKVARFLQEDTYAGEASDPLSLNLYTYCFNNPITYADPTGHMSVSQAQYIGDCANTLNQMLNNPNLPSQARNDIVNEINTAIDVIVKNSSSTIDYSKPLKDTNKINQTPKDAHNFEVLVNMADKQYNKYGLRGYVPESIVISGNHPEDRSPRDFIEPAIKQIKDWVSAGRTNITWVVANDGYSKDDLELMRLALAKIAEETGVMALLKSIYDKVDLFDYFNNGQDRTKFKINEISVFSHGLGDKYGKASGTLALGYNGSSEEYKGNKKLDISIKDLMNANINKNDFTKNVFTQFYSCNTGTVNEKYNTSFAQEWVNKTGGSAKAVVNGLTTYNYINDGRGIIWDAQDWKRRHDGENFDINGCKNYPRPVKGVNWHMFYPKK